MIKDSQGDEITYWPISGLKAGEDSEVLEFTIEVSAEPSELVATQHDDVIVWVREVGDPSYVNLSTPYDLSALSGDVDFELYIEALNTVVGFMRIPLNVIAGQSSPAGWEV